MSYHTTRVLTPALKVRDLDVRRNPRGWEVFGREDGRTASFEAELLDVHGEVAPIQVVTYETKAEAQAAIIRLADATIDHLRSELGRVMDDPTYRPGAAPQPRRLA